MDAADLVTFGLAFLGYVLLAVDFVLRLRGSPRPWLTRSMAAVVLVHVGCVWGFRFGWSLEVALRKSIPGFVVFHGALLLIVAAAVLRGAWSTRALLLAFPVVTLGAVPATFRYPDPEITGLKVPMLLVLLVTASAAVRARPNRA